MVDHLSHPCCLLKLLATLLTGPFVMEAVKHIQMIECSLPYTRTMFMGEKADKAIFRWIQTQDL